MTSRVGTLREAVAAGEHRHYRWCEMQKHPWCSNDGGTLKPGDALLTAVSGPFGSLFGSLWRIGSSSSGDGHVLADPATHAAWKLAERLVVEHAPFVLATDGRPMPEPPRARRVAMSPRDPTNGKPDVAVEGTSFGAAFVLSHASRWFEAPVPVDLVATATIEPSGALGDVRGLSEKLQCVHDFALSVRRVVVARSQEAEARAIAAPLGLEVIAVARVEDLFEAAWPERTNAVRVELRRDGSKAARQAQELELWITQGRLALPAWQAVERGASLLADELEFIGAPSSAVRSARTAANIAKRHSGGNSTALAWPPEDTLPERHELRARYLAQIVQSASDCGDPNLAGEFATRAASWLRPRLERSEGDLNLAGAIGRGWAASGDAKAERDALAWLLDTVNDWFAIRRAEESSRAVCECVRLAAVLRVHDTYRHLDHALTYWAAARGSAPLLSISAHYVDAELLRALVLLERYDEAQTLIDTTGAAHDGAHQHLPFMFSRWKAIFHDRRGEPDRAEEVRRTTSGTRDAEQLWLFALDRAVRDGARNLPEGDGGSVEVQRCLMLYGGGGDAPAQIQRRYRY